MGFLTLEDINTTSFNNQGFWWHVIDTADLPTVPFTDIKCDFCTISMTTGVETYQYYLKIDNSLWTHGGYALQNNGEIGDVTFDYDLQTNELTVRIDDEFAPIRIFLYMGPRSFSTGSPFDLIDYVFVDGSILNLNYKQLNTPQSIRIMHRETEEIVTLTETLVQGYNEFSSMTGDYDVGFLLVNLLKTDFQFTCTDNLYLGKVNTVRLGTDTDYKPNGDLIGNYTPTITVEYGNKTLPVTWDNTLNDYTFQLDLTNEVDLDKVKFKVKVEANTVLNNTETEVTLTPSIETITTLNELKTLFTNGGIGRLGANITVNNPLTIKEDTLLIGDNKILSFGYTHQLIISEDKTFKADSVEFKRGKHTIHQKTGSIVEITNSVFTECEGVGSCIECDIDLESLDNPNDFTTILSNCTFNNNYMPILHGGELTVTDSSIDSVFELGDTYNFTDYPYFLYQTDGNAVLTGNTFAPQEWVGLGTDLKFHPCIFTCGETATINGLSHTELQENNLTSFISRDKNQSSIDMEYYYVPISGFIHLSSDNGYCHSVSGVDYVFKTNVNVTRS